MQPRILVIDDDPAIGGLLTNALSPEYHVSTASTAHEGLDACRSFQPGLILLDIRLPDANGIEVLGKLRADAPQLPIIMLTGLTSAQVAVAAMKAGATDYVTKPFEITDLCQTVSRMLAESRNGPDSQGQPGTHGGLPSFHGLIGQTSVMQSLFAKISRIADTPLTVLVTGESGTGKELVARALHAAGARKAGPFVALNCAALPDALLENELFGHERGAFTDARTRQTGQFELAQEGTLFLDEIGDLSPSGQAKLLRVLQERLVRRIGGVEEIKVDVRLIAATNQDLRGLVQQKRFRTDLFYRLQGITLSLPPLRERPEDIPLLANHFLTAAVSRARTGPRCLTPQALAVLFRYDWPGNVRELQQVIEQACVWATGSELTSQDLAASSQGTLLGAPSTQDELPHPPTLDAVLAAMERTMIADAMKHARFVQTEAASLLGISRRKLKCRMDVLGIRIPELRERHSSGR